MSERSNRLITVIIILGALALISMCALVASGIDYADASALPTSAPTEPALPTSAPPEEYVQYLPVVQQQAPTETPEPEQCRNIAIRPYDELYKLSEFCCTAYDLMCDIDIPVEEMNWTPTPPLPQVNP
jgi:hypothetical protein